MRTLSIDIPGRTQRLFELAVNIDPGDQLEIETSCSSTVENWHIPIGPQGRPPHTRDILNGHAQPGYIQTNNYATEDR